MIWLHLDTSEFRAYRESILSERFAFRNAVDVTHESPRVESKGVIAFLEFVKLFHHGYRNHEVIVLKMPYSLVVVQNHICIQHENLGLSHLLYQLSGIQSSPSAFCIRESSIVSIPGLLAEHTLRPAPSTGCPRG